jgi:Glycosyl hydrolase family 115/Gylcosyl hydrolase family 115 C-terminal domain
MKSLPSMLSSVVLAVSSASASAGALSLKDAVSTPADFPIVVDGRAADILADKADAEVVRIAADLLAGDVERVTGVKPKVSDSALAGQKTEPVIVIGTLGKSALINDLVKRGKLDVKSIEGKWESFVIVAVKDPFPGVVSALAIAGSDRRGTAYGALSLSEAIGVSPWEWWADVAPQPRKTLVVSADTHMEGPPSVKYRGIFINDEDWGLRPWASQTFEPDEKNIGPKTYAKVCELLLRLKANYLWPAMHPGTKAFNSNPENKVVADRYAIVMGSSHAEPMLRNNVGEWPHDQTNKWNPVTNLQGILDYWEDRVRENGKYENVYTAGMRGIHDSGMPGGGTVEERRERLEKIIGLQRDLLAKYVNPDPSKVPQIFVPYKEVLELYQAGMKVPDDITLVWTNDNFGYIRQLPNEKERQRPGGSGIYYHLSYWGRPHDYLWLDSTSPALVWEEMTKAYEFDVQRMWVVNVGDIKPIETGMTLFLKMAWDIKRYGADVQQAFLRDFYTQQFGEKHADAIARLKDEYYRLCAIRRPEHMGFNRVYFNKATPNTPVQNSGWSPDESQRILDRWLAMARDVEALEGELPQESRDAYFQLVEYPACAGAAMAEKIILAEKARQSGSADFAQKAQAAFERIQKLTERYNAQNNGKWRGMMDYQPRKLPVFDMPPTTQQSQQATADTATTPVPQSPGGQLVIDAAKFDQTQDRNGTGWRVIEGLGPRGAAIAVLPHKDTPTQRSPQDIRGRTPVAEYTIEPNQGGSDVEVTVEALPTHRFTPEHEILAAVSIEDGEPAVVRFDQGKDDENDPTWKTNVLRNMMTGKVTLRMPDRASKATKLKLWAADPGVVVQRITLGRGNAETTK